MKNASQMLLEIGPATFDRQVALMLADKCIALTDAPYRFAINHDIRPPKNQACPLEYGWTRKDRVGIEWKMKHETRKWLTNAFLLGYTVYQMNIARESIGFPHSIAIARRRAENHQAAEARRATGYVDNDDDIPF
jgi:hypothetical protein